MHSKKQHLLRRKKAPKKKAIAIVMHSKKQHLLRRKKAPLVTAMPADGPCACRPHNAPVTPLQAEPEDERCQLHGPALVREGIPVTGGLSSAACLVR